MMNIEKLSVRELAVLDYLVERGATGAEIEAWVPHLSLLRHTEYKNKTPIFFTEEGKYIVVFPLPFLFAKTGNLYGLNMGAKSISRLVGTTEKCYLDREPNSFYEWSKIVPFVAVVDGKLCVEDKNGTQVAKVFGYADENKYHHRLLDSDIGGYCGDSMVYYRSKNIQELLKNAPVFLRSKTPELIRAMDIESVKCPLGGFFALLISAECKDPLPPEVFSDSLGAREAVLKLIREEHFPKEWEDRLYSWVYNLSDKLIAGLAEILYNKA